MTRATPPPAHDPLLPTVMPLQLLAEIERRGLDPSPLLSEIAFPKGAREQPFILMPLSSIVAFGERAAKLAHDDWLGLHAGEHKSSALLRVLAFACSGVSTGREALSVFVQHVSTIHDSMAFSIQDTRDGAELRQKIPGHPHCLGQQGNDHWVSSVLAGVEHMAGNLRVPLRITFAHPAPPHRAELVRVLRTQKLTFDAGYNGITFGTDALDAPLRNAGSRLSELLSKYASYTASVKPLDGAFLTRVRSVVEERLGPGAPSIAEVAKAMGTSGRTLQRRLAEEGLTFFTVLDGVRRDIALAHVERRDLTLDEIAARIGYAQKGAFFRSYRRWTGKTPRGKSAS